MPQAVQVGAGQVGAGQIRAGQIEAVQEEPAVLAGSGCRMVRLRQSVAGFAAGDLLLVAPDAEAQGGELVVDLQGRVGRYGGGAVWGVIVGAVRRAVAPPAPDPGPGLESGPESGFGAGGGG